MLQIGVRWNGVKLIYARDPIWEFEDSSKLWNRLISLTPTNNPIRLNQEHTDFFRSWSSNKDLFCAIRIKEQTILNRKSYLRRPRERKTDLPLKEKDQPYFSTFFCYKFCTKRERQRNSTDVMIFDDQRVEADDELEIGATL